MPSRCDSENADSEDVFRLRIGGGFWPSRKGGDRDPCRKDEFGPRSDPNREESVWMCSLFVAVLCVFTQDLLGVLGVFGKTNMSLSRLSAFAHDFLGVLGVDLPVLFIPGDDDKNRHGLVPLTPAPPSGLVPHHPPRSICGNRLCKFGEIFRSCELLCEPRFSLRRLWLWSDLEPW